jgi:polyisoprenyl-phosphate glycosyltransferase
LKISIVSPIYNEEESVLHFYEQVKYYCNEVSVDWEIIFCLDPSTDNTENIVRNLHETDTHVKMILMSRKFGQPAATLAGIFKCTGDAVIVMDCDLQDPPQLIPEMIKGWQSGSKIVLAQRASRDGETILKRLTAKYAYSFLNRFAEVPIPRDTGDFRLLDRAIIEHLREFPERNAFLKGLTSLVGYSPTVVFFERPPRERGITKYNRYFGGIRHGINGIVGFSTVLLKISIYAGIIVSFSAFLTLIYYGYQIISGHPYAGGFITLVLLILILGGLTLLSIGILGLYIDRIYEEVKHRPRYLIKEALGDFFDQSL